MSQQSAEGIIGAPGYGAPELDKLRGQRHELGAVTRAFCFFALLAAFLVAGVRCLSAFSTADDSAGGVALNQGSHSPSQQDPATGGTIDDDSNDGVDALLLPTHVSFALVAAPLAQAGITSYLSQQCPLQSHTIGLDRPPRA